LKTKSVLIIGEQCKTKFVYVMMNDSEIETGLKHLQQKLETIKKEWEAGEERGYLNFKN